MKNILITGGNGYIGQYLVDFLKKNNYTVYVTSRKKINNKNVLYMDLLDEKSIHGICKNMDVVIHMANLDERIIKNNEKDALLANSYAARLLYLDASENNVKKFIYFSTFHVYGKNSGNIYETDIPSPLSDYGLTHLFAEKYLEQLSKNSDTKVDIIRLTNGIGVPFKTDKWYLVLNDFCKTVYETGKIVLKSNGLNIRDFISIKDVVSAVDTVIKNDSENCCEIYNLSTEKTYSIRELAYKVKEIYEKKYNKRADIIIPTVTQDEIDMVKPLFVSSEKIKKLGWKPRYSLENVIKEIFEYLNASY